MEPAWHHAANGNAVTSVSVKSRRTIVPDEAPPTDPKLMG